MFWALLLSADCHKNEQIVVSLLSDLLHERLPDVKIPEDRLQNNKKEFYNCERSPQWHHLIPVFDDCDVRAGIMPLTL